MENLEIEFRDKNVLVTGGTGFVGSHLVEKLVGIGARVIVLDRYQDRKSYFYQKNLDEKVKLCLGDVENYDLVLDIVVTNKIDYVFHLAAQALVDVAIENPKKTLYTNILGTINILEACRVRRPIAIVVASSDKAYGKLEKKKYVESDPLRGLHPYDVSKTCADLISQTYIKSYDLPIAILRCGNIYGEGDINYNRIIPGIMKSVVTKSILIVRSNGKLVRDYIYVKDVVEGYLLLASKILKSKGEAFNLNTGDGFSVLDLIGQLERLLKTKIKYKILNEAKNEIPYQALDSRKIVKMLGFEAKYDLKKVASSILNWYNQAMK